MAELVIGLIVGATASAIVTSWYFTNIIRAQVRKVRGMCEDMEQRKDKR